MSADHLEFKDALLSDIVKGLRQLPRLGITIEDLTVTFHTKDAGFMFDLASALECLADDLFWDERGDWSNAQRATVTLR